MEDHHHLNCSTLKLDSPPEAELSTGITETGFVPLFIDLLLFTGRAGFSPPT